MPDPPRQREPLPARASRLLRLPPAPALESFFLHCKGHARPRNFAALPPDARLPSCLASPCLVLPTTAMPCAGCHTPAPTVATMQLAVDLLTPALPVPPALDSRQHALAGPSPPPHWRRELPGHT